MTDRGGRLSDALDRPRIHPAYVPVFHGPDDVEFRLGPWSGPGHRLRDRGGDGQLRRLVELLDGTRSLAAVLDAFPEEERPDVLEVLECLHERDVVTDATGGGRARGYLSAMDGFDPERVADALSTPVRVLGDGRAAAMLADDLTEMGATDASRVDLAAIGDGDLRATVEAAGFLVLATDRPAPLAAERANELAHETGTPWLFATAAGVDVLVGPTVRPGETACYDCFRSQAALGLDGAAGLDAFGRAARRADGPALPAVPRLLAGYAAVDVVHQLADGVGFTLGRSLHLDLFDLSTSAEPVRKLPRCDVCGVDAADGEQGSDAIDRLLEDR